jgi:hypothetical protein
MKLNPSNLSSSEVNQQHDQVDTLPIVIITEEPSIGCQFWLFHSVYPLEGAMKKGMCSYRV